jgi:hypothetical protein
VCSEGHLLLLLWGVGRATVDGGRLVTGQQLASDSTFAQKGVPLCGLLVDYMLHGAAGQTEAHLLLLLLGVLRVSGEGGGWERDDTETCCQQEHCT